MSVFTRRAACCGLATFGAAVGLGLTAAQAARPFCRFSLLDGWTTSGPAQYITHRAGANDRSGVPQVVQRIRSVLSIQPTIDVLIAAQEDNAFATVANGRKILVVDGGFLQKLNRMSHTEWAGIQVIAHEIGHHVAGFVGTNHQRELNADYWSGQTLQRLGSSKNAATRAILTVGTEVDTDSHPNKYTRAGTIERGWNDASNGKIDYTFCNNSCR